MVGAGQLARMTHQAAISLGTSLRLLADTAADSAALVAPGVELGDYHSLPDLLAFSETCDVVTFDHEHVPNEHLRALVDKGIAVRPGPHRDPLVDQRPQVLVRHVLVVEGDPVAGLGKGEQVRTAMVVAELDARRHQRGAV